MFEPPGERLRSHLAIKPHQYIGKGFSIGQGAPSDDMFQIGSNLIGLHTWQLNPDSRTRQS
jgi:hypothetical protein